MSQRRCRHRTPAALGIHDATIASSGLFGAVAICTDVLATLSEDAGSPSLTEPNKEVPMPDMLAARLHAFGEEMRLEKVPVPEPRPTDVVVQVKACNVVPNLKNVLATYAEWFPYLPLPQAARCVRPRQRGRRHAGR